MCNNFPNIRITEGNNFSLVLPLRSRTYVATKPIDEDIDPEQLENVVVTFGGVEYPAQRTVQGVQIDLPATLAVGTYNILLTADYLESSIRAAYESAVTIVPWSAQSTAEQYIAGSPIVMRAAYVLSGVMTDSELEALKVEWREKIAEAEQAKEEAEEARREWEQKAADLDGVAQETTAEAAKTAATQAARDAAQAKSAAVDAKSAAEVLAPVAQAAEAYNTGKVQLAENITAKGVQASATETLPELAEKVGSIAQTQTILEGGEIYAAQQFGDGALWNLYQVLADMKTRFMGTGDYAALIVCEYYKDYDSLVLQGADGYYTCDGDYYDYASPNHIWHDADNGKANRWVTFLYRDEGARLDITNTAISPRSMYIGGHIGTIEYFVNGRLTDFVCGVEETDVVDNLNLGSYTQSFGFNTTIRNIKNISVLNLGNSGTAILELDSCSGFISAKKASFIVIKKLSLFKFTLEPNAAIEIRLEDVETTMQTSGRPLFHDIYSACQIIYGPNIKNITSDHGDAYNARWGLSGATNLIDIWLGEVSGVNGIPFNYWNPTNVLADATKKARLIENIKNHILARISDRTGLTQLVFTVSTNMYNNIASEQIEWQGETMSLADAFLTKNWLLAGA